LPGEIKLKVAGREVTVNGQQAIDALKTNNAFKSDRGGSLREERPSNEVLAKAAERLTELTGEIVVPLEDDISKATTKLFPSLAAPVRTSGRKAQKTEAARLRSTGEPRSRCQRYSVFTDASDATLSDWAAKSQSSTAI
jgi:hypothetical protein